MSIKIGDKVRYLNSVGGGIVKGFRGKNMVLVEEEDGFETPMLVHECVIVGENPMQVRQSVQPKNVPEPKVAKLEPESEKVEELPGGDRLNILLAYLPTDRTKLQESAYEAYFINDSNYFLFFNYMSCENNAWLSRYNGIIEPNTKIFIEEFGKERLNELEPLCVQCVAFKKEKAYLLKNAVSVELRVDTVKFYKLHCFTDNDYFDEPAMIYPVVKNDVPERSMLIDSAELREAILRKDQPRPVKQPAKSKQPAPLLEVDLHIEALLDSTAGMGNSEILDYQLNHFREVLEANKNKKGQKIVFIHGKGEGVLRKALLDELKHRYKSYDIQDASFREYGFGATQVTIR
ncbi:MAG: DUF2027 domain-containing protein [Bacteroidales bacterium]|nr:DUF2027 domain-containing protein [Bacteroidales bacterium]